MKPIDALRIFAGSVVVYGVVAACGADEGGDAADAGASLLDVGSRMLDAST